MAVLAILAVAINVDTSQSLCVIGVAKNALQRGRGKLIEVLGNSTQRHLFHRRIRESGREGYSEQGNEKISEQNALEE